MKLHAEKVFSAGELGKNRISNKEFPMSKEGIAIALPFCYQIGRIPPFIIGHSILEYSLFAFYVLYVVTLHM
jgi:hypothetical protein